MFKPVNRYILVDTPSEQDSQEQSLVVLPEDYKPEQERFIEVQTLAAASDVRFDINHLPKLVVDGAMIEEISIGGTIYNVILDNYVVGMIE
jgi:hypothetical protein